MSRTTKDNLDYFSHDVDMFTDKKVKYLFACHGLTGYAVFVRLLEEIYREGYYLPFSEKEITLFASDNKIEIDVCKNIINVCINEGLFDINIFNRYHVLTSQRIQKNYLNACWRRKKVTLIEEYLLISPDDYKNPRNQQEIEYVNINPIIVDINPINDNNNGINDDKKAQTRNQKLENRKQKQETIYPENFEILWNLYEKKGSKKAAYIEFKKLTKIDMEKIKAHIVHYKRNNEFKFRKDFERYLKNELWVDYNTSNDHDPPCVASGVNEESRRAWAEREARIRAERNTN